MAMQSFFTSWWEEYVQEFGREKSDKCSENETDSVDIRSIPCMHY